MYTDVYVGHVTSDEFDYDVEGDNIRYLPTPALPRPGIDEHKWLAGERDVYWAVWNHPDAKQVEWGCCVLKMTARAIAGFLRQAVFADNEFARYLVRRIDERLDPDAEYVLTAMES